MNADQLLAHYEQVADAPDAIARLRRFILDLAVRGKLVEQDPNDGLAVSMMSTIATERKARIQTREMRKLPTLFSFDLYFEPFLCRNYTVDVPQ